MIKIKRKLFEHAFLVWTFIFCCMLSLFFAPAGLSADEVVTTYDTKTIRYPSMFVGQIWAKSTEPSSLTPKNNSSELKANSGKGEATSDQTVLPAAAKNVPVIKKKNVPDSTIKTKLKTKRLKTVLSPEKKDKPKTALNSSSAPRLRKAKTKTPPRKTSRPKKTVSSKTKSYASSKTGFSGKKWHYKRELFDVECSRRLARIVVTYYFDKEEKLLGSTASPHAPWYHIYPGSLEEKLYVELCHPSVH